MAKSTPLKRSLGLPMITFYGIGTIIGGGFYALIGKVSGEAGMLAPAAVLLASVVAAFSAFSFAELSARFPYSAGESRYASEAFSARWLPVAVGWMVIATGVVSAATLANAFVGFLQTYLDWPQWLLIVLAVVALGSLAAWGIDESAWTALLITVVELGGLVFVAVCGADALGDVPQRWHELLPPFDRLAWSGLLLGAYLAFYSFVGFEDMVNMAEEVKNPTRNLPAAILLALGITSVLYVLVALITVLSVPQNELVDSSTPLSLVVRPRGEAAAHLVTNIGMLAGLNGALVQVLMASRVAYGMAKRGQAPAMFARVHEKRQTPLNATLTVTVCVLVLALWFPLAPLAKATSTILLGVYAVVNLSLWKIKRAPPPTDYRGPRFAGWLPVAGFVTCVASLILAAARAVHVLLS